MEFWTDIVSENALVQGANVEMSSSDEITVFDYPCFIANCQHPNSWVNMAFMWKAVIIMGKHVSEIQYIV